MLKIGVDLGTTRIKGVLTDRDNRILAEAERTVAFVPGISGIEIDPEGHWRMLSDILRELAVEAAVYGEPVEALAFAAASGNTLLLDRESGKPLTSIISWLDERAVGADLPCLRGLTPAHMRQLTGWPCIEIFPPAHLAWLREYRPELLDRAFVSQNHDYLQYRLTGRHRIDYSSATPFLLADQCAGHYAPELLARFGIDEKDLPELCPGGSPVGSLTAEAAAVTGLSTETVVYAGSFDHPAAARAADIRREGQLLLSCGTSWVGFFPCGDRERIIGAELLCDPFTRRENGLWGAIFSLPGIGRRIDRYVNEFIAPGAEHPLRVFDELAGQGGAGGVRIDLLAECRTPDCTPAQAARAVMESSARLLADRLSELKKHEFTFTEAVMVGGPSRSPVWPGIVAETTGLKLTTGGKSAGAQGAAILCSK